MPSPLHHFRRNRTYSAHDRWGVFAGLFALTLLVSAGGWMLFGQPATSAASVAVAEIKLSHDTLEVGTTAAGTATITLADKETGAPAQNIWVGLFIPTDNLRTPTQTYFGWYSPSPERAFFQTDEDGQVSFPLVSTVPGSITYEIYAANPELANDAKYQSLHKSFVMNYVESK